MVGAHSSRVVPARHAMRKRAVLEFLHPAGMAPRQFVIGSGCPQALQISGRSADGTADLILLAPTRAECERPGWLDQAAGWAVSVLAGDGYLYLIAPSSARLWAQRSLLRAGLVCTLCLAHVPGITTARYFVPLTPGAMYYALNQVIPTRPWRRVLAAIALAIPGGPTVLPFALPAVGQVFQRRRSTPPVAWLTATSLGGLEVGVIGLGQPERANTAVFHLIDPALGKLAAITKVPLHSDGLERVLGEAGVLKLLGASAERAGARVPKPLLEIVAAPLLLESAVAGTPAAQVLARAPAQLANVLKTVGRWLEQWSRLTVRRQLIDAAWIERELIVPLDIVAAQIPLGAFAPWVAALGRGFVGRVAPLTAAHNDLTMWNVLLADDGALGVVDWEAGRSAFFPLSDLLYTAVDAVAAAGRYTDRLTAFQACMVTGGRWSHLLKEMRSQIAGVLDAPRGWLQLCFFACWLHHAANEQRNGTSRTARPFTEIVRLLVQHHAMSETYAQI